jgi:hypothetical protein
MLDMDSLVPTRDGRRVYVGAKGSGTTVGSVVYVEANRACVNADCDPSLLWANENQLHEAHDGIAVTVISPAGPAHQFAEEPDIGPEGVLLVSMDDTPCDLFWTPTSNVESTKPPPP